MYILLVTLVFSLALGPDVRLLRAQEVNTELMSMRPSQQSAISTAVIPDLLTESREAENLLTAAEETTIVLAEVITIMESLTTEAETVEPTSEEHTSMSTAELQTTAETTAAMNTPELLPTAESTVIPVPNTMKTSDPRTPAAPPEPTTTEQEQSTEITTTEPPPTPSPSPNAPHPPARSTIPPETPETSPTSTPLITTPTTQKLTTPTPPHSHTSPEETTSTDSSAGAIGIGRATEDSKKGGNWLIIGVIALVIFCILTTLCIIIIIIKRRRKSGKQNFRHTNGQRFNKKKGTEDDIWAGPVKLGGGDCEGPEEAVAQGEKKITDMVEEAGLSTFSTLQENGGVGRPGSPEVEKWEEKEPLMFIDQEGKEKETDGKEAESNRGETFCLTTAV